MTLVAGRVSSADIFAGDPERLARFEREAKVLTSLNHPNITTIQGMEEADGKRVTFNWTRSFVPNVYWQAADGSAHDDRAEP